jgi:hypothetical protein
MTDYWPREHPDRRDWEPVYTAERREAVAYIWLGCRHFDTVPVESIVTGEELARLCLDCDAQLPPSAPR